MSEEEERIGRDFLHRSKSSSGIFYIQETFTHLTDSHIQNIPTMLRKLWQLLYCKILKYFHNSWESWTTLTLQSISTRVQNLNNSLITKYLHNSWGSLTTLSLQNTLKKVEKAFITFAQQNISTKVEKLLQLLH
jgi:hypothetical protein